MIHLLIRVLTKPFRREVRPCMCGSPSTPGVVHRLDGPCYLDNSAYASTLEKAGRR